MNNYSLSIAPMVGYTNRYFRYTMRQISRKILLFTEMVTSSSILKGKREKILCFSHEENPVIFQLAGSIPKEMAECAKIIEDYGYAGINLNIGCPSKKVQKSGFGLCLMQNPELVAEIVSEMKKQTSLPISIKTRIGIDNNDSLDFLQKFVQTCKDVGVKIFFLHARKGVLSYNPRNNRKIPPINYQRVQEIKQIFPNLKIIVNGEITSLQQAKFFLNSFDGVMVGRSAIQNPLLFQSADSEFFNSQDQNLTLIEIISCFFQNVNFFLEKDSHLMQASKHLFNLFHSQPNAKYWKRYLGEQLTKYPFDPFIVKKNISKTWQELLEKIE